MFLKQNLQTWVAEIVSNHFNKSIEPDFITVEYTNPEHKGDFTVILFPLLKLKIGNPQEIGNLIGKQLMEKFDIIETGIIIKGFLNLTLKPSFWVEFLKNFDNQIKTHQPKTIMIEFSSPNTNKPLHLGHLRNIFLGDAISRIYAFL